MAQGKRHNKRGAQANEKKLRRSAMDPLSAAILNRDAEVLDMVRAALRHNQVLMVYQPVVQTQNPQRAAFYEGLVRVLDETGRIIPAREFIDQIEDTELGRIVDCLSLTLGLEALAKYPGLRLAINMSARSIGYTRWMQALDRGLSLNPTIAERLILEITERSAMSTPEQVIDFMDDLQLEGISFALDDFGAGHTAIRYFKDFNFDVLKIDGQFIQDIHQDANNQVVVQALISIARQFDMFVVAEHVEKPADAECLARMGVDCMQGYFFGAPTLTPPWLKSEQSGRATA